MIGRVIGVVVDGVVESGLEGITEVNAGNAPKSEQFFSKRFLRASKAQLLFFA